MATKITKRTVDATQPADKRVFLWDTEVKGFGLQVLPSGIKSYVFRNYSGAIPINSGHRPS
jgi:hypothetical protein